MSDVNISDISLQVNYSSKKAESGINKLVGALKNLRNTVKGLNLKQIVDDINQINDSSNNAGDELANGMEKALMPINEINKKLKEMNVLMLTTSKGSINDFVRAFKDNVGFEDVFKKQADAVREMQLLSTGTALEPITTTDFVDGEAVEVINELALASNNALGPIKEFEEAYSELNGDIIDGDFSEVPISNIGNEAIKTASEIELLKMKVSELQNALDQALANGDDKKAIQLALQIKSLENKISRLEEAAKKTSKTLESFRKAIGDTTRTIGNSTKAFAKSLPIFQKHTSALKKLADSFKRIVYYRAIRSVIREISQAFQEGTKNIARYSKALNGMDSNNANKAMSELATTSLYLQNSIGAAVIPVLNALIPVLNSVADAIVNVVNMFNMLFNSIAGRSTFTKAKKYAVDYADSLDKAGGSAKKLKDHLLGIDELNVLNDNNGSGSGGGNAMDYSQMFEEAEVVLPDWLENLKNLFQNGEYEDLGKAIADLLANALKSIDWNYIKSKAGDIGKSLAEFLNGLFDPELFYEIGRTIAEGLNMAFTFAYNFATTFDWKKAGLSAAELVNGFIENFDAELFGKTIYETIHGALDLVTSFFENVEWKELGQKIMDTISNIDWGQLLLDLAELGAAVLKAVKETLNGIFEDKKTGKIDIDKVFFSIALLSCLTTGVALTNMLKAALPTLGTIAVQLAIVIAVASISFEGGLSLGQIMAEHGLLPEGDEFWYESFSLTTFFDDITRDFGSTFDGIALMLTDFVNNPAIAMLGMALFSPISTAIAIWVRFQETIADVRKKIEEHLPMMWIKIEEFASNAWDKVKWLNDSIGDFVTGIFDGIKETGKNIVDKVSGYFDDIKAGWENFWKDLGDGIYDFCNGVIHGVEALINGIIDIINSFEIDIPEITNPFTGEVIADSSTIGFNLSHVSWGDLPRFFAKGGFPQQGQLFVANESGPEMIGGWGNQTAVANNGQIVAGIEQGVATAVNMTLAPYLSQIANNTGVTANKDFSVKIGDRDIARANTRGQRSMGRQLIYTV